MANEILILLHASTGSLATISGVWLFSELLNAKQGNIQRIKLLTLGLNFFVWLSYIFGGWYYVFDYSTVDKYIIKGSTDLGFSGSTWTFAHAFFTESKEHFFFLGVIIALYLILIAYRSSIVENRKARNLMLVMTAIIVLGGIILEGWGAIMAMGVRLGMTPL
ncbi:MAG: hypothetical protein ACTSW1_00795 [Candidatus Hodarchaeales archaeon]